MTPDDAWTALDSALRRYSPPCAGLDVFTADRRTDDERALCASICMKCPIRDLCDAYATAARVEGGYWAGADRNPRRKSSSTTADRTASGTH